MDALKQRLQLDMDKLRGRLFTLIEAAGLPESQQEALKKAIRLQTYDSQQALVDMLTQRRNGAHH